MSTSLRFTEKMKGFVAFGDGDFQQGYRGGREAGNDFMFHLTIETDDVQRFIDDARHEASARGYVGCEALGGKLPVQNGIFNLFVDQDEPNVKRMLYRLHFQDGVGHPLTMSGYKVIRNDHHGLDLWPDTSTLYVRVLKGHVDAAAEGEAEPVATGILRILKRDFARQLTTFRARGPSLASSVAGLVRFVRMFVGQLWVVYAPRRARRAAT